MNDPTAHPTPLNAEALADTINWNKYDWSLATCESNGLPIYPAEQARADFISMIKDGAQLEYCGVCKKKHIVPGPPITISCRDPCGDRLPRWFPRERYSKNPWAAYDNFRDTMDLLTSFVEDPNGIKTRLHKADSKWAASGGQNGGWWTCRGENNSNTSPAELECELCHRHLRPEKWEHVQEEHLKFVKERLEKLNNWVSKNMEARVPRGSETPVLKPMELHTGVSELDLDELHWKHLFC